VLWWEVLESLPCCIDGENDEEGVRKLVGEKRHLGYQKRKKCFAIDIDIDSSFTAYEKPRQLPIS
jgi:hypothetical protein